MSKTEIGEAHQDRWVDGEELETLAEHFTLRQLRSFLLGKAGDLTSKIEAHIKECELCEGWLEELHEAIVGSDSEKTWQGVRERVLAESRQDEAPEPFLVRLWRKTREGGEDEIGRVIAAIRETGESAAQALSPRIALAASGTETLLEGDVPFGLLNLTLNLIPGESPDDPDLELALVFRLREKDRFDLKATALAPEEKPVEGIRLRIESEALEAPIFLESDEMGDFPSPETEDELYVVGLRFASYSLEIEAPGLEEPFVTEIADVKALCRPVNSGL